MIDGNLLTSRELLAQAGVARACQDTGHTLFSLLKFSDVVEISKTGISQEDFDYACKAHIDFVLAKNNKPVLAIEFEGSRLDERRIHNAEKKDRISHFLGLDLLRIDAKSVSNWELEMYMYEIIKRWHSPPWTRGCAHKTTMPYQCRCKIRHAESQCAERDAIARSISKRLKQTPLNETGFEFILEVAEPTDWSTTVTVLLSNGTDQVPVGAGFATATGKIMLCRRALAEDSAMRSAAYSVESARARLNYPRQSFYIPQVAEQEDDEPFPPPVSDVGNVPNPDTEP